MAGGARAFQRESAAETMTAIIREDPVPLPAHVPAPLRWAIDRCLSKDPADRYDSTRDLYRELRQVREHLSDVSVAMAPSDVSRRPRIGLGWVTAAVFAATTVAALFWPLPLAQLPQVVPFATEAAIQTMSRWSPQGDRIAFVADVDGVLQVFTKSLGSSTRYQITREAESCLSPMWSGDGSRIYYLTGIRPRLRLRSVAVVGGEYRTVLENVYSADISPDGRTLAVFVSDSPGTYRLAFASPPDSPPQPYAHAPFASYRTAGVSSYVAFEPGGSFLGVAANTGSANQFWRIPSDRGPAVEVSALRGQVTLPFAFLGPDRLVHSSAVTGPRMQLMMGDLVTGATSAISSTTTRVLHPSSAPDGATLALASGEIGHDVIEILLDGSRPPRDVIATAVGEVAPAWADEARFVYSTLRTGSPEIWVRNRFNDAETRIAPAGGVARSSSFLDSAVSPEGSRVAYRATLDGNQQIWISPLSGEAPSPLWADPDRSPQRGPSWSPDGNEIAFYGITKDERAAVMKIKVGANTPPDILAPMLRLMPVRWSPRNNWILYRDGETLKVVSADGKQNHIVSERVWETYGWSGDGTRIVGVARGDMRRLWLMQVDIESRQERRIADLGPVPPEFDLADSINDFAYRGFSLHPDGKSFLTSVLRFRTQIYLMKDFDRRTRLVDRWLQR
jgi:Tol biopolymer transport system component